MPRVKTKKVYVIARGAAGRPTCQHLTDTSLTKIACNNKVKLTKWSRSYQDSPIDAVLCKKRACRA